MGNLSNDEREVIQRALGIIEGATSVVDLNVGSILGTAVEMIDEVLDGKAGER